MFGEVWDIDEMSSSSSNLERFVRSVLFENELVYDIHFHIHVLRLYGNLLAGVCLSFIRYVVPKINLIRTYVGAYIKNLYDIIQTTNIATKRTTITAACESFLSHMMKLLNMFVHLVQNTSPPIAAELKAISTNSVTQTQPGSSSPLKAVIRKSSDVVVASIGDRRTDDDEKSSSTSATEKKHHESTKAATAMALGYFSNSVHYMKIYSRLKISFAKYKVRKLSTKCEARTQYHHVYLIRLYIVCCICMRADDVELRRRRRQRTGRYHRISTYITDMFRSNIRNHWCNGNEQNCRGDSVVYADDFPFGTDLYYNLRSPAVKELIRFKFGRVTSFGYYPDNNQATKTTTKREPGKYTTL